MIIGILVLVALFVIGFFIDEDSDGVRVAVGVLSFFISCYMFLAFYNLFAPLAILASLLCTGAVVVVPYFGKIFLDCFTYDEEVMKVVCWAWGILIGIIAAIISHNIVATYEIDWLNIIAIAIPLVTAVISIYIATENLDGCGFFSLIGWFLFIPLMVIAVAVAIIGTILVILGLVIVGILSIIISVLVPPTVVGVIIFEG